MNVTKLFNDYMTRRDWRVKENSNSPYNFGSMNKFIIGAASKEYWCEEVYDHEIKEAHNSGFLHIHDMSGLTLYCCGYSLQTILQKGVRGISNIPTSSPAKHFDSALNQISNLLTIYQNEIMGAVALSSFDTLLAPFIFRDKLSYNEVVQGIQNFIYSINSNSRAGAEPAFTNLTFDLTVPPDLAGNPVVIANEIYFKEDGSGDFYTYADFQHEMDILNEAFYDVMLNGDAENKPFAYPIPTYSIQKEFDFDDPKYDKLWEMTGKYGYPYFSNYVNSDMKPSDVRSMCCRLRLDLTELRRRNGGLFGSGDSTGSIGVVTLNLPRLGYLSSNKQDLFGLIEKYMVIAKNSLEDKRNWLSTHIVGTGMIPAFDEYVGTIDNHFLTIGLVGLNEMIENCSWFGNHDILDMEGKMLAEETLDFMRAKLIDFQKLTGHLYNLEATPAESTCYRLAKLDVQKYPDIKTQGNINAPYYTNSCHIPVKKNPGFWRTLQHQDTLQTKFTGGTVVHLFSEGSITGAAARELIRKACNTFKLPYLTYSPVIRLCSEHGYFDATLDRCPICGSPGKTLQRITGYIREVSNYNPGKLEEFNDRKQNRVQDFQC